MIELKLEKFFSLCLIACCCLGFYIYWIAWLKPQRIYQKLRQQGLRGPPLSFLIGNLSEIKKTSLEQRASRGGSITHSYSVFPYLDKWRKDYGPLFVYSIVNVQALHVSDPDMVKDISLCVSLDLGRSTFLRSTLKPLFGDGLLKSNGEVWARQRKIIAPELFLNKIKGMVELMVDSTIPLLKLWDAKVEHGGGVVEVRIDEDLRNYSADVISRACFGSSYSRGKEIFLRLRALQKFVSKPDWLVEITGSRFLPTKTNREIWKLEGEVRSLILGIVEEGRKSVEKNILQAILQSNCDSYTTSAAANAFIVDLCKNIYFAGHETTAVTATWCLMLLAMHQEWQDRVRSEVIEVCAKGLPEGNSIQKMKVLNMVIQETLRLYPPAAALTRETLQDKQIGSIHVPRGTTIYVQVDALHRDPEIWGADAHEFNPGRFINGVLGACQSPHVYVPFGAGTRTCIGQHFAMLELKIVLSLILRRFSFSLSPSYQHSPVFGILLEPEFGMILTMKSIN